METLEFFNQVLARQGLVCLLELVGDRRRQTFYGSHADAADAARLLDARGGAVYHACATFKTDENRKQENAAFMRSFWVDADVDPANPEKYPDLKAALIDLGRVAKELGLPLPLIVKSGNGAHAYWPLTEDIDAGTWTRTAETFKAVLERIGFRQDRTRTADGSSVLRPVGTTWRKRSPHRPVAALSAGTPLSHSEFLSRVDASARHLDVRLQHRMDFAGADDLSAGIEFPPSSADRILSHCATLAHVAAQRGNVGEPLWRAMLGVVKFTVEGAQRAHEWSAGHPEYDEAATQDKFDRWTAAPTTCAHFRGTDGNKCAGCPQKVTSPIHLGYIPQVPPPEPIDSTTPPPPLTTVPLPNWVDDLNARFAWIAEVNSIYDLEFRRYVEPARFRIQEDTRTLLVPGKDGANKVIRAGTAWLLDARRRQHKRLVLRPAEPVVTSDNCLNEWRGFAIAPVKGDVKPFIHLFQRLFPEADICLYVLRWLAYLIQHPGEKMFVALVVWSIEQGVGKNLLFECISSIIGPHHATVIGQRDLTGHFNASWLRTTIFTIGNEVSSSEKRQESNALKGLLTDTEIWVEQKHQPAYRATNRVNFVFLSNHPDAVFVEDNDRRFFIHEIKASRLPPDEVTAFVTWRDNGGLAALHDFLLRVDLTKFDPKAPAPMTASKQIMIDDSRSELERWLRGIMTGDVAQVLGRELVTASELGRRFANTMQRREAPSSKAVTLAAKRLGAVTRHNQIRVNGEKVRPLALAQPKVWGVRSDMEWVAELNKPFRLN